MYDVETDELTLTHQQVEQMLEARTLRSTDLIFINDVWTTLVDSMAFADAAAPAARREARIRWVKGVGYLLAAALMFAVLMWLNVWLSSISH